MQIEQNQIREFMVKAGQDTPDRPLIPSAEVRALRVRLIAEELVELAQALAVDIRIDTDSGQDVPQVYIHPKCNDIIEHPTDLVEAYDAVEDLMVVTIGTGVALGTNLQPGWDEVHSSNMSKFIDGHRREDGKWIKGPSYRPAQLRQIIEAQLAAAHERDQQRELSISRLSE